MGYNKALARKTEWHFKVKGRSIRRLITAASTESCF
jgi:hypothetical protein